MHILTEPLPLTIFIRLRFNDPRIAKLIESWSVSVDSLENIAIKYIEEMGIYTVDANNQDLVMDLTYRILKHSPEVATMLAKLRELDRRRREKRHSDI